MCTVGSLSFVSPLEEGRAEAYYQQRRLLSGSRNEDLCGFMERALEAALVQHKAGGSGFKKEMGAVS